MFKGGPKKIVMFHFLIRFKEYKDMNNNKRYGQFCTLHGHYGTA